MAHRVTQIFSCPDVFSRLAGASGSGLVTTTQPDSGAVLRSVRDKLGETLSVEDFGAVGDGVTNDTAAFVSAFAAASDGATVTYHGKHVIDSDLTIPDFVTLMGPTIATIASAADFALAPAILLNSAATIFPGYSAGLRNCAIYRKGLVFPSQTSAAFAGTAIDFGFGDAFVIDCQILGFAQACVGIGGRIRYEGLRIDCLAGIDHSAASDVIYLHDIHCWPFVTQPWGAGQDNKRSGSAIYVHDTVDLPKFYDIFAYGYANGFYIKNVSSPEFVNCSVDNVAGAHAGSVGWRFEGSQSGIQMASCAAWSCETGALIAIGEGSSFVPLTGFTAINNSLYSVKIDSGDCNIMHSYIRHVPIIVNDADCRVNIDYNVFSAITPPVISSSVATTNVRIGENNRYIGGVTAGLSGTNCTSPIIAANAAITIYTEGETFNISGTTGISTIAGGTLGRVITLIFGGAELLVTHGTTALTGIYLAGGKDFLATANATLTLRHNGVQWYEMARSTPGYDTTTPTATSSGGAITVATTTLRWQQNGNRIRYDATVGIVTNGGASGQLKIPLPFTPITASAGCGHDSNNRSLAVTSFTDGFAYVTLYDGTYPGADGRTILVSGEYVF